ncbi:Ribophorin I [Venturia nashicola]|nr:Ribophorin I [Venturia nashicola]
MRLVQSLSCVATLALAVLAEDNSSKPLSSKQILPSTFKPPQVFENVNLVRNVNLDKGYPREKINVFIKNIDSAPQSKYYLPFEADLISRIGGLEVRDKKDASKPVFKVEVTEYDTESATEFYLIHLPEALAPKAELTLGITFTVTSALNPLPETIAQMDQQTVQYITSAYATSAYKTLKQKTKLKLPTANIPDYTVIPNKNAEGTEDPTRQGSTLTYGPYDNIPAGALQPIAVRYDFTKPLLHATLLERDIEVSHWGGNLATEERYWLGNRAAKLKDHFSRVQWQMTQYTNPPTTALRELKMPLKVGSLNPYFTDDIGNVSTSRFRTNSRQAMLELKPRYPVFGGWFYSFKVGWDSDLKSSLRQLGSGDGYVLKVPFLEGPKMPEGIEYEKVEVRIILPEGAKNIKFTTSVPIISDEIKLHKTFMDTVGRSSLILTALNVVDEWKDRDVIVTYDYPWTAGYRKPITITAALGSIFVAIWVLGNIDTRIDGRKR